MPIEFITKQDLIDIAKDRVIPWGTFGEVVDIRTYRRWLPNAKRRENPYERWQRIINYNLNLVADKVDKDTLRAEALLMLHRYASLQADLSGRTKWVGGTTASTKDAVSQFNCSFRAINQLSAFGECFGLLMNGCGVGFRVFPEDIAELPVIKNKGIGVFFDDYNAVPKASRKETTEINQLDDALYVTVGDSKEGWIDAVNAYLNSVMWDNSVNVIVYNFNNVRPIGERIKGFGGTASGYDALRTIIKDIYFIIQELPENKLRSIDCMDIVCCIAKGVVAGSSRRSALITLFAEDDELCAKAKVGLYTNPDMAHKKYRAQSNNTMCMRSRPDLAKVKQMLETCKTEGEPGFNNYSKMVDIRRQAAINYRPENPVEWYTNVGTNPCHEIVLSAGPSGYEVTFCNLTTLPLPNFVLPDGTIDYVALDECIRLNVRASLRQTCVDFNKPGWTATQADERLLGVSITGAQDFFNMMGWKTGSVEIADFLTSLNTIANDEADKYAEVLGVPRPLLVCTIKPEGTSSSVFGTSSGLHWDWSPYYIRRVEISAKDSLAKCLIDQGFKAYPRPDDLAKIFPNLTIHQWEEAFTALPVANQKKLLADSTSVLFEFPVKSYSNRTQSEVSALEQLENSRSFTKHYVDHMASVTISVKDHEWEEVAEWVTNNWDDYVTASFFPYYGSDYPLLPFEAITEEEYLRRLAEIPDDSKTLLPNGRWVYTVNQELLNAYEVALDVSTDDDDLLTPACPTGTCPVR